MASQRIHPLVRLTLISSAIFLAVMAWLIVDSREDRAGEEDEQPEAAPTAGITAPVDEFLVFADGHGAPPVGMEHDYTAAGIVKLSAALEALGGDLDQLATVRRQADALQGDARSLRHADVARGVFTSAGSMLGRVTGKEVSDLRAAAEAINPDRPLLQQTDAVRHFFRTAAGALRDHSAERNSKGEP